MLNYLYNVPPKITVIDADVKMCVHQYSESVPREHVGQTWGGGYCASLPCVLVQMFRTCHKDHIGGTVLRPPSLLPTIPGVEVIPTLYSTLPTFVPPEARVLINSG